VYKRTALKEQHPKDIINFFYPYEYFIQEDGTASVKENVESTA